MQQSHLVILHSIQPYLSEKEKITVIAQVEAEILHLQYSIIIKIVVLRKQQKTFQNWFIEKKLEKTAPKAISRHQVNSLGASCLCVFVSRLFSVHPKLHASSLRWGCAASPFLLLCQSQFLANSCLVPLGSLLLNAGCQCWTARLPQLLQLPQQTVTNAFLWQPSSRSQSENSHWSSEFSLVGTFPAGFY